MNINQKRTLERWIDIAWCRSLRVQYVSLAHTIDLKAIDKQQERRERNQRKRWARVAVYWEGKLKELEAAA